jgi:hypothetical protein
MSVLLTNETMGRGLLDAYLCERPYMPVGDERGAVDVSEPVCDLRRATCFHHAHAADKEA